MKTNGEKNSVDFGELSFLLAGVAHQDSLLQSYRGFQLTLQSILLAIGIGLTAAIVTIDSSLRPKRIALFVILLALAVVAWGALRLIGTAIESRHRAVDWWQVQLMKAENGCATYAQRYFSEFKRSQGVQPSQPSTLTSESAPIGLNHAMGEHVALTMDVTLAEIHGLVRHKGSGHVRATLESSLWCGLVVSWVVCVLVAFVFMVWF